MDTKKYEVFAKTVELGSLTRAAEELGLTQSGVSHILAAMEEELGFTLLKRSRAGVRLTAEGEQLLPCIREIVRQEGLLRERAASLRGGVSGTVRNGTFTSVATHWLPGMMQSFQTAYPGVEFRLFNGDYHDVDGWLRDGSVDLGFVALPLSDKDWECIVLRDDPLLVILPPDYDLQGREQLDIHALQGMDFLMPSLGFHLDIMRALGSVEPNIRKTQVSDSVIISMVEHGLGVSVLSELVLKGRRDNVVAVPMDPPAARELGIAVRSKKELRPIARRFITEAKEILESDQI